MFTIIVNVSHLNAVIHSTVFGSDCSDFLYSNEALLETRFDCCFDEIIFLPFVQLICGSGQMLK